MAYAFRSGLGAEAMGPPQDPNAPVPPSGSATDQLQAEIDALYGYTGAGKVTESIAPIQSQPASPTSWLSAHSEVTTVAIIIGALLFFGGRRR